MKTMNEQNTCGGSQKSGSISVLIGTLATIELLDDMHSSNKCYVAIGPYTNQQLILDDRLEK